MEVEIGFKSALDYLEETKSSPKLSTGSDQLNAILGGGIEAGSITELFGESRTGKT